MRPATARNDKAGERNDGSCKSVSALRSAESRRALMDSTWLDGGGLLSCSYILKFQSLFNPGKSLVFPCDAQGRVLLDELSERARENYFHACTLVGREYAFPVVSEEDSPH